MLSVRRIEDMNGTIPRDHVRRAIQRRFPHNAPLSEEVREFLRKCEAEVISHSPMSAPFKIRSRAGVNIKVFPYGCIVTFGVYTVVAHFSLTNVSKGDVVLSEMRTFLLFALATMASSKIR